jgi:hypothetical protein
MLLVGVIHLRRLNKREILSLSLNLSSMSSVVRQTDSLTVLLLEKLTERAPQIKQLARHLLTPGM